MYIYVYECIYTIYIYIHIGWKIPKFSHVLVPDSSFLEVVQENQQTKLRERSKNSKQAQKLANKETSSSGKFQVSASNLERAEPSMASINGETSAETGGINHEL